MIATPTVAPVLVVVTTGAGAGGAGGASAGGAATPSRFVGGLLALLIVVGLGYGLYQRGAGSGLFPGGDDGTTDEAELADADRVERTLAASGGQLERAALAAELDWSASRTSRVLSELADDGRVEELEPDGAEVVSLPGREDVDSLPGGEDVGALSDGEDVGSRPDDAE